MDASAVSSRRSARSLPARLPAARRRPVKPTQGELDATSPRGARRLGASVALGVTLVLALITWVSLSVDTPPKARIANEAFE